MSLNGTPQGTRPPPPPGAAGTEAPIFANPPPQLGPMLMSPDQFRLFMDKCVPQSPAPAQLPPVAAQDDGGPDFPNVSSVAVKLPTFWTHDPDMWFLQTESVFNTRTPRVTWDSTKFDHVVTALPADALNAIQNIIRMPAATPDRYARLKRTLLQTYGKTAAQKHVELIQYAATKEPVLDTKPTIMLLQIRELAGDAGEAFQRSVLLNRLPSSVRTTLSTSNAVDNDALALKANQMMEAFLLARPGCTPASVMAMESATSLSSSPSVVTQDPSPPGPPGVAAAYRPPERKDAAFLCFFHAKYGSKAFNCKSTKCPMYGQTQQKPASGNGRAGR